MKENVILSKEEYTKLMSMLELLENDSEAFDGSDDVNIWNFGQKEEDYEFSISTSSLNL